MLVCSAFVNVCRPDATTDTAALVQALRSERIRAVLDVVDPEPLPADHPLWTAPNVMISPHSAGDTPGAGFGGPLYPKWIVAGALERCDRGEAPDALQVGVAIRHP